MAAVGEVQPHRVHARVRECAQQRMGAGARADGRDDLRLAHREPMRLAIERRPLGAPAACGDAHAGAPPALRGNADQPGKSARPPSSSSIRSSWLYFATRSERAGAPVLICPTPVATARSAMVLSSVSPERCEMTAL